MPNWHIEFEVTGKYLSDAQATVHTLRGVTNIGVRPIMERRASSNGGRSIRDCIVAILKDNPKGVSTAFVHEALTVNGVSTTPKKTAAGLHNMVAGGWIRRVKPGVFALTAKGKARA